MSDPQEKGIGKRCIEYDWHFIIAIPARRTDGTAEQVRQQAVIVGGDELTEPVRHMAIYQLLNWARLRDEYNEHTVGIPPVTMEWVLPPPLLQLMDLRPIDWNMIEQTMKDCGVTIRIERRGPREVLYA